MVKKSRFVHSPAFDALVRRFPRNIVIPFSTRMCLPDSEKVCGDIRLNIGE